MHVLHVVILRKLKGSCRCLQAQGFEIMDSGVSRIQLWREQKKKERQEKRRAHYEKNREKIIEKVTDARRKLQEEKSGRGRSLRNKNVPVKDSTKKHQRERNQKNTASKNKEKIEKQRKMARERSKRYRQKKKDQNTQVQAKAMPLEVPSAPFPNRMAKKRAVGRVKEVSQIHRRRKLK